MKKQKEKIKEIQPEPPFKPPLLTEASAKRGQSDKAHKPAVPVVFKRPVFTNPFAKGFQIRQNTMRPSFPRTRRSSSI